MGGMSLGIPGALSPAPSGGGGPADLGALYAPDASVIPYYVSSLVPNEFTTDRSNADGVWDGGLWTYSTATLITPTDSQGVYIEYDQDGLAGSKALIEGSQVLTAAPGADFYVRFRLPTVLSNMRLWMGMFFAAATSLATSNPSGDHAALFYDGTGNFEFVSKDASTQEITDTGELPTLDTIYAVRIAVRSGSAAFTLYDQDHAVLAGPTTHTTNTPRDDTRMHPILHSQMLTAGQNRPLNLYACNVAQRLAA